MKLERHQRMLLLLFGLFALPIVVAWLFSSKLIDPRQFGMTNQGFLLDPPLELGDAEWLDAEFPAGIPAADWLVVELFPAGPCDENCARIESNLSALPLIMGQEGTRIRNLGVTTADGCSQRKYPHCRPLEPDAFDDLTRTVAERAGLETNQTLVAFIDWRENLMIAYPQDFDPNDVKKDLKRLLKATRR